MTKKLKRVKAKPTTNTATKKPELMIKTNGLTINASAFQEILRERSKLVDKLIDPRRNINEECGYPDSVDIKLLRPLYERDGMTNRVVSVLPDETWSIDPKVYEDEDSDETEFEAAWNEMLEDLNLWYELHRIDMLSGIGRFGILFLGLDDGLALNEPAEGIDLVTGLKTENTPVDRKLLFVRPFDEGCVVVNRREDNLNSPRFGQPVEYNVIFKDTEGDGTGVLIGGDKTRAVHWTRVVHIADNRHRSEIFGVPRPVPVLNRLIDIRKILGGSGEMFWRGGFPGLAFEINPTLGEPELNTDELKEEIENYMNSLQRYIAVAGISAKSLAPEVADPASHLEKQIENICVTIGVPKRIFMGSEAAQLASSQDARTWNRRLGKRQMRYVSPKVIRAFVDRLIAFGCLPTPKESPKAYKIHWEDLNSQTDGEKAQTAYIRTQALALYISSGLEQLIAPDDYLGQVQGFEPDEVESIMAGAADHVAMFDMGAGPGLPQGANPPASEDPNAQDNEPANVAASDSLGAATAKGASK